MLEKKLNRVSPKCIYMRMGVYYRALLLEKIGIKANQKRVLDVGCYDGYWLSHQPAMEKFGVDLNPLPKFSNITYIKADACELPFSNNHFDQVFSFDVLEHVNEEKKFITSLLRVTKQGGEIILTTPQKDIKIFPCFLTKWISKKWDHYRVIGYSTEEIKKFLLADHYKITFLNIRGVFYRSLYLFLAFFWKISEDLTKPLVYFIVFLDNLFLKGPHGFLLVRIIKNN